ncbi:hypothetical protein EVAR_63785_1 [Eumeta japonica]|uniref:Uncharacterized protein n=1 Tax=Eumeta variegata TaxID=151549 RepID=A0A4C1ZDL5_EUMVA|nr:hypothetical protein EVAR_63785_1 [Eumeta japonica]
MRHSDGSNTLMSPSGGAPNAPRRAFLSGGVLIWEVQFTSELFRALRTASVMGVGEFDRALKSDDVENRSFTCFDHPAPFKQTLPQSFYAYPVRGGDC